MSARCSICGSENTNKSSCPLNPEAPLHMCAETKLHPESRPCPWHVDGVTGERGNPLKHPNAVEILRKQQGKQISRAAIPGESKPSGYGTKVMPVYHDQLRFTNNVYSGDDDRDKYYQFLNDQSKPGGKRVNFATLKASAPQLTGHPSYHGHYNLGGDLVYTSLHGMITPAQITGVEEMEDFDGFVGKHDGKLYTFRRIDYGWYPLEAQDARYEYLHAVDLGDDINNLNKYLMVHTISAEHPSDLPTKIKIDVTDTGKGVNAKDLQYSKFPLTGPKTYNDIRDLFRRKFSLPLGYRNFLKTQRGLTHSHKIIPLIVKSLALPATDITFNLSKFERNIRSCNSGSPNVRSLLNAVTRLFMFDSKLNQGYRSLFDGLKLADPPTEFSLGENRLPAYLRDICALLSKMLEGDYEEITPQQANAFHQAFEDIVLKYSHVDDKELKRVQAIKNPRRNIGAKKQYEEELMALPPTLYQGSILYPGGRQYIAGLESFKGKDIPWTDYCYTMLDNEHLEDLRNLAGNLGLKLNSKATKTDVCLLLTDYYDRKLAAEAANIPFTYTQETINSPRASVTSPKASSPKAPKASTPKASSPKASSPKAFSPKASTKVSVLPKATSPKASRASQARMPALSKIIPLPKAMPTKPSAKPVKTSMEAPASPPISFSIFDEPSSSSSSEMKKSVRPTAPVRPTASVRPTAPIRPTASVRPTAAAMLVAPPVFDDTSSEISQASSLAPMPPVMPPAPMVRKSIANLPIIAPRPKKR